MCYQLRQLEEERMVTQDAAAAGPQLPARRVTEREAWSAPGVPVLALSIATPLAFSGDGTVFTAGGAPFLHRPHRRRRADRPSQPSRAARDGYATIRGWT